LSLSLSLSIQILLNLIRSRLNLTQLIPNLTTQIQIRKNLTRHRLNLIPLNRSRLNPTQLIPSLSIQILMNPIRNRLNLIPMNWTPLTRLRPSQFRPNNQTDNRKKGLRALKEPVNESASLTPLLNRPALTRIVRGRKLACV
jgi:hypothetical protein